MDIGLLIVRAVVGALFVGHGTQKLFGWFGGHGLKATGGFFESLGFRPGRVMAGVAGVTEALAGLLLIAGFLTPLAAAMIIGVMLNAVLTAKREAGLWGGYELDLVYALVAAGLAFTGAGAYSVDAYLPWQLSGVVFGLGAIVLGVVTGFFTLSARHFAEAPAIPEVEQIRRAA